MQVLAQPYSKLNRYEHSVYLFSVTPLCRTLLCKKKKGKNPMVIGLVIKTLNYFEFNLRETTRT